MLRRICAQIENFPPLHRSPGAKLRNSPIGGVLLTNADLDHVLGLLLLRESTSVLCVHATRSVRETLVCGLRFDGLLKSFCGVEWREPTQEFSRVILRDGSESSVRCRVT
jgi:pyrroloquinoline quinone biosynthesis protein B